MAALPFQSQPGERFVYGYSTDTERNETTGTGAFWTQLLDSRRGYALPLPAAPGNIIRLRPTLNEAMPTQFDGVFKPSNSSDIRPQLTGLAAKGPLDSTRLRADFTTPTQPLLRRAASLSESQSMVRSVVHAQLGHTRLANLASEQSNVFAVWITVGLFEVDGSTLTVGQEVGSDTGEVRPGDAIIGTTTRVHMPLKVV